MNGCWRAMALRRTGPRWRRSFYGLSHSALLFPASALFTVLINAHENSTVPEVRRIQIGMAASTREVVCAEAVHWTFERHKPRTPTLFAHTTDIYMSSVPARNPSNRSMSQLLWSDRAGDPQSINRGLCCYPLLSVRIDIVGWSRGHHKWLLLSSHTHELTLVECNAIHASARSGVPFP
jgi:hypothetical protein